MARKKYDEVDKENLIRWRANNREHYNTYMREYRLKNPERMKTYRNKEKIHTYNKKRWEEIKADPEKHKKYLKDLNIKRRKVWSVYMCANIRRRAKNEGREFNIEPSDISPIPKYCPVLGIELEISQRPRYNSPSVDRIDNTKGYIKGNIQLMSAAANQFKCDMSIDLWNKMERIIKHGRKTEGME